MNTLQHRVIIGLSLAISAMGSSGCAGHENRVEGALEALDRDSPVQAVNQLDKQLGVRRANDVPKRGRDNALLLLDRGTVQLSMGRHEAASRDMGLADKALDVLDLSRTTADEMARYLFTDDAGAYRAPAHEKLLLNTLNMVNYLAMHDLSGARVEARRLAVMQKYLDSKGDNALIGIGSYLAGFTFEQSGRRDEALLFYEEALQFSSYTSLQEPLQSLTHGEKTSPAIDALVESTDATPNDADSAEIIVVIGDGRVAQKVPMRIPIGQALQLVGTALNPNDRGLAESYAARGLVTWVNYPALGPRRTGYQTPTFAVDGESQSLERPLDVDAEVRRAWGERESTVILSALTRLLARTATGAAVQGATTAAARNGDTPSQTGSGSSQQNVADGIGMLLGLATTATMSAVDTPDTRSWSTLPARMTVGRVRVAAGKHKVSLSARGIHRTIDVALDPGGWVLVPLFVLR